MDSRHAEWATAPGGRATRRPPARLPRAPATNGKTQLANGKTQLGCATPPCRAADSRAAAQPTPSRVESRLARWASWLRVGF